MASIHCGYPLCTDRPQLPARLVRACCASDAQQPGSGRSGSSPRRCSCRHSTAPGGARRGDRARDRRDDAARAGMLARRGRARLAHARRRDLRQHRMRRDGDAAHRARSGVLIPRRACDSDSSGRTAAPRRACPMRRSLLDDRARALRGAATARSNAARSPQRHGQGRRQAHDVAARSTRNCSDIAGVVDGAFLVADEWIAGACRALVVAPAHTAASLRAELARRVDPAFMPRPLLLADALPRDAQGKLPRERAAAALARRACSARMRATRTRRGAARSEAHATSIARDRTRRSPDIFPGIRSCRARCCSPSSRRVLDAHGYRVTRLRRAKFLAPVAPGERCTMRVDCADPRRGRSRSPLPARSARGVLPRDAGVRRRQSRRRMTRKRAPLWRRQAERGSLALMRALTRFALLFGRGAARAFLPLICVYFIVFSGPARRASRDYLARVLRAARRGFATSTVTTCASRRRSSTACSGCPGASTTMRWSSMASSTSSRRCARATDACCSARTSAASS